MNGTLFPNALLDHTLAHLTGAQAKVLAYLIRRSLGMGQPTATLSLDQIGHGVPPFDEGTGLARKGVQAALWGLHEKGVVEMLPTVGAQYGNVPLTYRVVVPQRTEDR